VTADHEEPSVIPADASASMLADLADQIAERLADRLGPRIAQMLADEGAAAGHRDGSPGNNRDEARGLWTAQEVAAHYCVEPRFVYAHADELGCVRLGGGARPRLRFDPGVVRDRWSSVRSDPPVVAPRRRPAEPVQRRARRARDRGYELIEFDAEP
jgi:hypothetical protein